MRCSDERCTGCHDDRHYDRLCPRTKENKAKTRRGVYARNRDHYLNYEARRRGTAKNMLAKMRYEATRRGGRSRASAE